MIKGIDGNEIKMRKIKMKSAYKLLLFAIVTEVVLLTENLIINILSVITDNLIVHTALVWLLTYVVWGSGFVIIAKRSKILYHNDLNIKTNKLLCIFAFCLALAIKIITWGGFKPYIEFNGAIDSLGIGLGIAAILMQYIYYAFEAALMLLILALGQQAGNMLFGREIIPYGGILLAILWGIPHLFTQSWSDGLIILVLAILYGVAYNAIKSKRQLVYPLVFLMFII